MVLVDRELPDRDASYRVHVSAVEELRDRLRDRLGADVFRD